MAEREMTMVERVARGIRETRLKLKDAAVCGMCEPDDCTCRDNAYARIAIASMTSNRVMNQAGGASIANQFTDPYDVLSPHEEEALGLEVDGPDAFEGADKRLAPYAADCFTAMIDAALSETPAKEP